MNTVPFTTTINNKHRNKKRNEISSFSIFLQSSALNLSYTCSWICVCVCERVHSLRLYIDNRIHICVYCMRVNININLWFESTIIIFKWFSNLCCALMVMCYFHDFIPFSFNICAFQLKHNKQQTWGLGYSTELVLVIRNNIRLKAAFGLICHMFLYYLFRMIAITSRPTTQIREREMNNDNEKLGNFKI